MGKRGPKAKVKAGVEPQTASGGDTVVETVQAAEPVVEKVAEPAPRKEYPKFVDRPAAPLSERIAESRKALLVPLAPGQIFFEAPDGMIIVGEADRDHVWYREGNGGKGMFINPRR